VYWNASHENNINIESDFYITNLSFFSFEYYRPLITILLTDANVDRLFH